MKYKIIKKSQVKERVKVKGVEMTFRKALSEVKINNEIIFQAVEQGYGFKNEDIFVYYYPEYKKLVLQWFHDEFMKGIVLKKQRELETSVIKQTKEQKMYSENVNQHLNRIIAMKQNTLEALLLYQSTVTYASVVKGAKASNTNIDDDNVSNMTEQSIEKNANEKNPEKKRKE